MFLESLEFSIFQNLKNIMKIIAKIIDFLASENAKKEKIQIIV